MARGLQMQLIYMCGMEENWWSAAFVCIICMHVGSRYVGMYNWMDGYQEVNCWNGYGYISENKENHCSPVFETLNSLFISDII